MTQPNPERHLRLAGSNEVSEAKGPRIIKSVEDVEALETSARDVGGRILSAAKNLIARPAARSLPETPRWDNIDRAATEASNHMARYMRGDEPSVGDVTPLDAHRKSISEKTDEV